MAKVPNERIPGHRILEEAFPFARCLWEQKVPRVGTLYCYSLGTSIVLIQDFMTGGWNAFTPTTESGRIDATIEAIAAVTHACPVQKVIERHRADVEIP